MTSPVMFYFWAHNIVTEYEVAVNMVELDTPTFRRLLKRASVVFVEEASGEDKEEGGMQQVLNAYIQSEGPHELDYILDSLPELKFLCNQLRGTGKRLVFENSRSADFDYNLQASAACAAFLECPIEEALEIAAQHLKAATAYDSARDTNVRSQIAAIKEPVVVLFGSGHRNLAEMTGEERPVEVNIPYVNYPDYFGLRMRREFRKTGEVNPELYCRSAMEAIVRGGISNQFKPGPARELVSNKFAEIFSMKNILEYKSYLNSFSRFYGLSLCDIFESFLKKESLPSVQDVRKGLSETIAQAEASLKE